MAWRIKSLVLFTFLFAICVLFLLEYITFTVKLPSYEYGDNVLFASVNGHISQKDNTQEKNKTRRITQSVPPGETDALADLELSDKHSEKNYQDNVILPLKTQILSGVVCSEDGSCKNGGLPEAEVRTTPSDVTLTKEHALRIENLKNACRNAEMYRRREQRMANLTEFYYSRVHKFAYCKVPKSGSTFWMKIFMILSKGANYSKLISQMSRAEIHARTRLLITDPDRILHNNIPTIVVSRNPFSRLFSAYIDKVYMPLFWDQFPFMENVRVLPSYVINGTIDVLKSSNTPLSSRLVKYKDSLRQKGLLIKKDITQKITPVCANNATFGDFLKFIISEVKSGRALEPHWAPISHLCHPCRFNTVKIVKQESFSQDVDHTLASVGVDLTSYKWLKRSLKENRAENSVPGIVAVVENKLKQRVVKNCIDQSEVVQRLWKSFQIQGFINMNINYPEEQLHVQTFNRQNVSNSILGAISQKPMTSSDTRNQREFFLKQAYGEIPLDIIAAIQDIYYLDFLLFNYSFSPPK